MSISKNSIRTSLRGHEAISIPKTFGKAHYIRLLPISFLMVRNDDEVFRGSLMSRFKISLSISIICILLSSCGIFSSRQIFFDKIVFGKGGGFTGKYDEYFLNKNGGLYKKDPSTNSFTLLKELSHKETKNIFKEVESNKLFEIGFNHPYNITCYMEIEKGTVSNRIVWGDAKTPPPSPVAIVFDKLMSLTKTNTVTNKKGIVN